MSGLVDVAEKIDAHERRAVRQALLALVLALALTWYVINPAPGSVGPARRGGEDRPDERENEEARPVRHVTMPAVAVGALRERQATPRAADDEDELDWPEFLSLD